MTTTTADKGEQECREAFNAMAQEKGLVSVSHGIRSEWMHLDLLREFFLAGAAWNRRPTNEGQHGLTVPHGVLRAFLDANPFVKDTPNFYIRLADDIARHLSSKKAAPDAWQKIAEGLAKERESIKEAICWPDEWDSVCYDTLDSALLELFAWFKASKEIEAEDKQADHIGEANKMVKADAVKMPEPMNVMHIADQYGSGAGAYSADQLQSYATAHTAEAVRELVERLGSANKLLFHINQDVKSDFITSTDALLAKYAPSQEGGNRG